MKIFIEIEAILKEKKTYWATIAHGPLGHWTDYIGKIPHGVGDVNYNLRDKYAVFKIFLN